MKWLYASLLIVLLSVLTGCAVPKYSYDKEDAGTVFLSLTSNFAMSSHMANWQITFEALDEKASKELPGFGMTTATKIYDWAGKPEQQFKILSIEKFGNVTQSTKLAPGRYKVRTINRQDKLIEGNLPAPFKVWLYNDAHNESVGWMRLTNVGNAKTFPKIEFTIEPDKTIYLGSFNAGLFECTKVVIFDSCAKFEIEVRDEFKRDSQLLKEMQAKRPQEPNFEFMNRTLKIDKVKSPYLFSE